MKCPKCDKEMIAQTYGDTEVDKCPECEGIFFDRGELDRLVTKGVQDADSPEYTELSNKMDMMLGTCPRCNAEMEPYLGPGNLRIDRCTKCDAVFLDQGELAELIAD
jgi:Zn-finger nucleic acid-binding protein